MGLIVEQYARGEATMAFAGSRNSIWHRLGNQMKEGMSLAQWAVASGLNYEAIMVDAYAQINGELVKVDGVKHCVRSDNGFHLGVATDVYKPFQPIGTLEFLQPYVEADSRIQYDVAGTLFGGKKVWATAVFKDEFIIGGDKHKARLLATTSFDRSIATTFKALMTRVVCDNTLEAGVGEKSGAEIKVRHNSKVDLAVIGKELSVVMGNIEKFKRMGDAMSEVHMKDEVTQAFFKKLLNIEEGEEINTRKLNMLGELNHAYDLTVGEGTEKNTAWTVLNAVTRYVDHMRGTRDTGHGTEESRFVSAQYSTGAAMKAKAVSELYAHNDGELANLLKVPLATRTERPFAQPLVTRAN